MSDKQSEGRKLEQTQAHTPTPWTYGTHGAGFIVGSDDEFIAQTWDKYELDFKNAEANAAHIVKCVNNHDELVKALEAARPLIEDGCFADDPTTLKARELIRAALAKLERDSK